MNVPRDSVVEPRQQADRRAPRRRVSARPPIRLAPAPELESTDLKNPALYINRELSWLEFNERVLAQARDTSHPLLERLKFFAITGTNLDEFFMIRVSTTLKKLREGIEDVAPDGYNTEQQLDAMRLRARQMLAAQNELWKDLRSLLAAEKISFLEPDEWTPEIREHLTGYFSREICPVLTPLAFDPGHPFPFISNLSKNFAVVVKHGGRTKFARVKVPDALPRFVTIPESLNATGALSFVFLEDVIRANIHELFPGTQVKGAHLFRIIRDADLEIEEDEADDLLESVDRSLKNLRRGAIALLHVEADIPTRVLNILVENFEVTDDVVLRTTDRLGFGDWLQLTRIHGAYDLGQVLLSEGDFMIIDFEGDPSLPMEERRRLNTPLRDVANMIRSFQYAAGVGLTARLSITPQDAERMSAWARWWHTWTTVSFLNAYRTTAAGARFLPSSSDEIDAVLKLLLIDQALNEIRRELANRPEYVWIPLQSIVDAL